MNRRRFFRLLFLALAGNVLFLVPAHAGFFGGVERGKSGLDLNHGYDINTVTTVTGKAVSLPRQVEGEHVVIEVKTSSETVNVCVGPATYWQGNGIAVNVNDDIAAKGSMAQGQDGKNYLMARKVTNHTTGGAIELRTERGAPAWSGRGMGRSGRPEGGMMNRGGGMMRGGGGGMMRR